MVVSDAIHNIMGGMESTAGVRLHNHRRKLKQRFDIIKKLGQGTYGKVQLGINKETGQEVAIKTIKKSKIETDADLVRIRREIQIMSSVQHPNIIHIYEVFENREKMVLVMEYAAGGELYDYLSERKVLDETEARRIFRQISTAVYYCHKHKICHRDLKLENILLDEHGSAKIADFGLSNVFDEQRLLGTFCGSPLYASPEIVKGTPYHGPEVDCWSLGVLLYTLVYGAMPFDGSNFKRLVKQISQGDYFEPKKPSPASSLIRDMLNVNPACRADIEKICSHWWVNECQAQSCVEIAEELANQTPVRLDLLLSLAPPPASGDPLLTAKEQEAGAMAAGPARSQSVGSLMELDHPRTFDAEKRRLSEAGQPEAATKENAPKRKLEQGPSTDEANQAGAKRKERGRRKDREHSTERKHRSSSRTKSEHSKVESPKKQSPQEPSPVLPKEELKEKDVESMDVDVVPTQATKNVAGVETIRMEKEEVVVSTKTKEPVKQLEESSQKTEGDTKQEPSLNEEAQKVKVKRKKKANSDLQIPDVKDETVVDQVVPISEVKEDVQVSSQKDESSPQDEPVPKETEAVPAVGEVVAGEKVAEVSGEAEKILESEAPVEVKEKRVIKKLGAVKKKSELSSTKIAQATDKVGSPAATDDAAPPAKPMVRRRSKIFESEIQKFNSMSAMDLKSSPVVDKPKKVFIPGVKVSDFKKAYERKSSVDIPAIPSIPTAVKKPTSTEKPGKENKETADNSDKSLSSSESSKITSLVAENNKEAIENSEKPVVKSTSPDKIKKPDVLSVKSTDKVKTPEKEKVDTIPSGEDVQEGLDVENKPAVNSMVEVKTEPVAPLTEKPTNDDESQIKKQKALAIIGNAIAKPPKPTLDKLKTKSASLKSPPESPKKTTIAEEASKVTSPVSPSGKKLVKIQVGPNDIRNAILQVSTPEHIRNFNYNETAKTAAVPDENASSKVLKENTSQNIEEKELEKPLDGKKSSKVEIVLKSATLPRRKTSKAEIKLGMPKSTERPPEYRSEVEHMVGTHGNKLQNQRSEVAFPVAAATPQPHRSTSVEPESAVKTKPKERIIPIQFERPVGDRPSVVSPPPSKPPVPPFSQRSMSQRSSSLSRQSTLDSDTESTGTVSGGPEPIRKSPREFIIPIAVEGGGYVTPRAGSLEPDSTSESTPSTAHKPRKPHRFPRTMRMGSLLSDGGLSEDEGFNSISSPFGTLNRHREQREGEAGEEDRGFHHMHRLRSSRPSRRATLEHADSLSSAEEEEDDDDDGFELLTAESLFSTLLSRVRNLTQRLNVDEGGRTAFPASRFMNHNFPSHGSFWGNTEPLSRRVSETSQFARPTSRDDSASSWRRSTSRDTDCDSQFSEATSSNNPSTLPRGPPRPDVDEMSSDMNNSSYPSYFTPSLARRIQRTNQELRNRTATNQDSCYSQLPPRDYSTLPNSRPLSRTGSLRSEDGSRRPGQSLAPSRSPSCIETMRAADKSRGFESNGSRVGMGDGGHLRGYTSVSDNGRDYPASNRRSMSFVSSKDGVGSSDSLNLVGKKDYGRDRNFGPPPESDSRVTRNYLPPTRRNISMLDGGHTNSLPRRNQYRSCMSDTVDYAPKKVEDYQRGRGVITEQVNSYDHETLPPLPQPSVYGRKRDGGVQRSSSYLRQRALDIANIYGAPLPSQEPTRFERGADERPYDSYRSGTTTPTNQPYAMSTNGNLDDITANRFGKDSENQRGRSQIPTGANFRSNSLNRGEIDQSPNESVREAIIRRQKSYDKLNEQDKSQKSKLRRPLSLSLQLSSDKSLLNKFYGSGSTAENNVPNNLSPNDNNPTSPVRSPGRKVSRFLRPDFYDTPREDSTFAKEKDEAAKIEKEAKNERIEQILRNVEEKSAKKAEIKQSEIAFNNHNGVLLQKPEINTSQISEQSAGKSDIALSSVHYVEPEQVIKMIKSPQILQKLQTNSTNIDTAKISKNINVVKSDQTPLAKPLNLTDTDTAKISKTINVVKSDQTPLAKPLNLTDTAKISKTINVVKSDQTPLAKPLDLTNANMANLSKSINVVKSDQTPLAKPLDLTNANIANLSKSINELRSSQTPLANPTDVVATEIVKPVEAAPKIAKVFKPKILKKESVATEKSGDVIMKSKESVSKESKDLSTKLPLKIVSDSPNIMVVKEDEIPNVSSIMVENSQVEVSKDVPVVSEKPSAQGGEHKDVVAKVAEGSKVKVKRKVKKVVDRSKTASDIQLSDSFHNKIGSKASVTIEKIVPGDVNVMTKSVEGKLEKPLCEINSVNNSVSVENENKSVDESEAKVDKDTKFLTGRSRIEKVIRSLRERSLTPKGSDDILSESNLLKRAVSVDDCSSSPVVTKSTNKIKKVIKSLKELTSTPKTNMDTESNLLKRAVSVDDCSNPSQTKSNKVNSVLGMFRKMEEPKGENKSDKKTSLLSRFRKTQSLYAGSRSDSVLIPDCDKDVEKNDKIVNSSLKKFGLRSMKNNTNGAGFEPQSGKSVAVNGLDLKTRSMNSSPPRVSNQTSTGNDSKLPANSNSEHNVSCSVKVRLPEKDVAKYAKQNGTSNGEDVSVSTTLKVVKDVTNEKLSKTNPTSQEIESSVVKNISNVPRINGENGVSPEILSAFTKPKCFSKIPQMSTKKSPTRDDDSDFKDARTGDLTFPNSSSLSENSSKLKNSDPCSSSSLLSEDEAESFDSCSVCSDWEFRTSPLPAYRRLSTEIDGTESMQDRIRRKSFYSRFNDSKKKPVTRRPSASLIPSPRDSGTSLPTYSNHTTTGKPF